MAKIIQLQRGEGANPVPVIIDDAWTVLRGAEGAALTEEQIVAAAQGKDAVLFPLTAWLAHKDGIDWFLPPQARANARLAAHGRTVARSLLTISGVLSLVLVVFLLVRDRPSALELSVFAAAMVTPVLAAVCIRFAPNPTGVLLLTNLAGIAYVAIWASVTGGVLSVAIPWLIALLATLGTFGKARVLLVAFAADVLVLVGLYLGAANGLLQHNLVPPEEAMTLALIAQLSSLAVVAMAARIVVRARAAAKESVRQGAQRLQRIVDGLPASIAYAEKRDGVAHYSFANRRFAERLGKTPEEVAGLALGNVTGEATYPQDESLLERMHRGEYVEFDNSFSMADGMTRYDRMYLVPDWTEDGGQLTPSMKLRRQVVMDQFAADVEALARRAEDRGWLLVVDDAHSPLGWVEPARLKGPVERADLHRGGTVARASGSLRAALDAALSAPSRRGVLTDDDGRLLGTVRAADVLAAIEADGTPA